VICTSVGAKSSRCKEKELAVRRRLSRDTDTLGVRDVGCGAEDCLTGDELNRRFDDPAGTCSGIEAEAVRVRNLFGRG
jgi:hypothetical protein